MKEIWKPIKGFEKLYEISSLGRVKSLKRLRENTKYPAFIPEIIMKPSLQKLKNYFRYRVNLWKGKKCKSFKIHRLVAYHFLKNPENKPQVNHIDNNPLNNIVTNLEWVTGFENVQHCIKQGRFKIGGNKYRKYVHKNNT